MEAACEHRRASRAETSSTTGTRSRRAAARSERQLTFFDETLRDGIQSPSVRRSRASTTSCGSSSCANDLGIDAHRHRPARRRATRAIEDVTAHRASTSATASCTIKPACAARTHLERHPADRRHLAEGRASPIEVLAFIGSLADPAVRRGLGPRRACSSCSAEAIDLGGEERPAGRLRHRGHHPLAPRGARRRCSRNAVEHGAHRLCLCDTVGHATPDGIRNLLNFTRNLLDGMGAHDVGIDWHGHNDRGLGVVNAIFALEYGADRVHGTALGIGERVGNAALDQMLLNLKLLGELPDHDLTKLLLWCKLASQATPRADPAQLPARRRATRSAPPPASTPRRSSRPRRRATPGSPTASTRACPPGMFGTRAGDRDRPQVAASRT